MSKVKRSIMIGATAATIGVAGLTGLGVASAATDSSSSNNTTIVDKIATKFNLNKDDVQKVFDENRAAHRAEMQANFEERLATAVKDGKLTQAQADHIKTAVKEIETLMGDKRPSELDDTTRDAIREKRDALRDWADESNIDMRYVGPGGGKGHGGPRGDFDRADDTSDSSDTTTSNS